MMRWCVVLGWNWKDNYLSNLKHLFSMNLIFNLVFIVFLTIILRVKAVVGYFGHWSQPLSLEAIGADAATRGVVAVVPSIDR